jgi:hypothetical protein
MGLVVFLGVVGALTLYAFHALFDAAGWGFIAALVLFALGMNASHHPQLDEQQGASQLAVRDRARANLLSATGSPIAALKASLAAVLGIGAGWLLWAYDSHEVPTSSFMKMQNERLLAAAPLRAALESVPSGGATALLGERQKAQFRAKMTFQNATRDYCRQYEFVLGDRGRMAGIACRIPGGDWAVVLQSLLLPSTPGAIVPAGSQYDAALNAATGALMDGNPLIGEAEAAVMHNGWRN